MSSEVIAEPACTRRRLVFGVTGTKGAGKDAFSKIAEQEYGATVFTLSDPIRKALAATGKPNPSIPETQSFANSLRQRLGGGYWATQAATIIAASTAEIAVVNGLRNPGEICELERAFPQQVVRVAVVGPLRIRASRLLTRARAGDPTTLEAFIDMDDVDRGVGQPEWGQQVDDTIARVPYENRFNNSEGYDALNGWVRDFITRALKGDVLLGGL